MAVDLRSELQGRVIRIRGQVQGVGFRPFVWHLANELGVTGSVHNDNEGVLIRAFGESVRLDDFELRLMQNTPPLARVSSLESLPASGAHAPIAFAIVESDSIGSVRTPVTPDAATCPACLAEISDPHSRFHGYPFTSCTHCGPRLSITRHLPYDRPNTSMAGFPMCAACQAEYDDPADRRFHAQSHACPDCGPQLWLCDNKATDIVAKQTDAGPALERAARLLREGKIVAIKGIGGFHLAVDATNGDAVRRLRARKLRDAKPFALMAPDIACIGRYARVSEAERGLLVSHAAPIVLLERRPAGKVLPESVAPGLECLGFMLPYTPLHSLLMQRLLRPIVLTSGNLSDEPQCIANDEALERLSGIADAFLLHDREIVNRLDDSVATVAGGSARLLRRARGYAPAPIHLHADFAFVPRVLAMGGEMKSTFCMLESAEATLSQHLGDLEHAASRADYRRTLDLLAQRSDFTAQVIAVDLHPDYASTRLGQEMSAGTDVPLIPVQHHHAHVAAVMAEQGLPPACPPVLGIALDGLGFGEDGTVWGGEFLMADFMDSRRLGCFEQVAMPGGTQAIREPWRNTFAHLSGLGIETLAHEFATNDMVRFLDSKPLDVLQAMMDKGLNSPLASSCGRLFDAMAAALGVCRERIAYEGQAAIELEALAACAWHADTRAFPFALRSGTDGVTLIDWQPMWLALLHAMQQGAPVAELAARFHRTVADAIGELATRLCHAHDLNAVVLCGGSFQNRLLLESVTDDLVRRGLTVHAAHMLPMGDGGLSLGQAAVAAARLLKEDLHA